jgi:hypothetical protein
VLEHAVWLDLVKRRFEQALLLKFVVVVIIVDAAKLLGLLI